MYIKRIIAAISAAAVMASSGIAVYAEESGTADIPDEEISDEQSLPDNNTSGYDYKGQIKGMLTANADDVAMEGKTFLCEMPDVNTALAENGGALGLGACSLTKSGDGMNVIKCTRYGINSILLAVNNNSRAYISDSTLSSSGIGSNGIFAADNAAAMAKDCVIDTTADDSCGIAAAFGGTVIAYRMNISTSGSRSAALFAGSDEGKISLSYSMLDTLGADSPLIRSAGNTELCNVSGTAAASRIADMESGSTVKLCRCELTGSDTDRGILISGTAAGTPAVFTAEDSSLASAVTSGTMFDINDAAADIILKDTELGFDTATAKLMNISGGSTVSFSAHGETLSGDITSGDSGSADIFLLDTSSYTGCTYIEKDSTARLGMNIADGCIWVVTGDAVLTDLNAGNGAVIVDMDGNTVTVVADGKKVIRGESEYTVTVTGSFGKSFDIPESGMNAGYIDRSEFDGYYNTSTSFTEETQKTVTKLNATAKSYTDRIKLFWNEIPGAESYTVYLYTDGRYEEIKTTRRTYAVIQGLDEGRSYSFRIKYKKNGRSSSKEDSVRIKVSTSSKPSAKRSSERPVLSAAADENGIKLSWTAADNAEKYKVYNYSEGRFIQLYEGTGRSIRIKKVEADCEYSYAVTAFINGEWTKVRSSEIVTVTTAASPVPDIPADSQDSISEANEYDTNN
ncbi:MAG: hypothetical protein II664_07795 [Oscillospiraceae bacterium]|nr:hypothetical protein [Oscillospiraceae bacterium]